MSDECSLCDGCGEIETVCGKTVGCPECMEREWQHVFWKVRSGIRKCGSAIRHYDEIRAFRSPEGGVLRDAIDNMELACREMAYAGPMLGDVKATGKEQP